MEGHWFGFGYGAMDVYMSFDQALASGTTSRQS